MPFGICARVPDSRRRRSSHWPLASEANTAIFSLIDAVMLKYLPVSHPEELLQVILEKSDASFTNPLWEALRDRQQVFSRVFAFGTARFNLNSGGEARYASGVWASADYFLNPRCPAHHRTHLHSGGRQAWMRRDRRTRLRLLAKRVRRPNGRNR